MAVTLSSSTKQPARSTISHWTFRLESAIARVIAEGKVRTYEKHVRSPRRHGLAVARTAKTLHSMWQKLLRNTPVHRPRNARLVLSYFFLTRKTRLRQVRTELNAPVNLGYGSFLLGLKRNDITAYLVSNIQRFFQPTQLGGIPENLRF